MSEGADSNLCDACIASERNVVSHSLTFRGLLALAWVYAVVHFFATGVRQALDLFTSDFLASFPSYRVARLVGRVDMFQGSLSERWTYLWGLDPVWHYGPLLHLMTLPLFAFDSLRTAFKFWLFVNYLFVGVTLWLLVKLLESWRPTFATTSLVVIATFSFNPFYETLTIRAIEIFELLLVVAAYAFYTRGRRAAAGVVVGLAVMTKFLPLVYLPYFALRRDWRALGASIATILPIALITQWVLGWQHSGILLQLTSRNGSIFRFDGNQSLAGFVLRFISWTGAPVSGVIAGRIAILIAIAALSLLFLRYGAASRNIDMEWWLLAAAMILLPPHNQNYYLVFLLPAFLFLFVRYSNQSSLRSPRAFALYASYLIVGLPVPLSLVSRLIGVPAWPLYLQSGVAFVGAATLVVLLAVEMAQGECRREAETTNYAVEAPV